MTGMAAFDPILVEVRNAGAMTGAGNNTYLLAPARGSACLIDAGIGAPAHVEAVSGHLRDRGAHLTDVLVTHAHFDHVSGAPALRTAFGGAAFAKYPWPAQDVRDISWRNLEDGDQLVVGGTTLIALHTPGHAPDHLVFWHEATRTVFSGDLVNPHGTVVIAWSRQGDLAGYLASLERVLALKPSRLLPAHGPVVDDPRRLLRATLDHRRRREAQVLQAVAAGHETVPAIADSIYDGLDPALLPPARENVRAHLEKLKNDGMVAQHDERWHRVGN